MDFTFKIYKQLLAEMLRNGYEFQTYADFIKSPLKKSIILRHDVDDKPYNSLMFAKIQAELGIKGVYYFRAVSKSWNEFIIKEISLLGHEIGYHYENLSLKKGNYKSAIEDFEKNLKKLRQLAVVETICMHGSPISKYDSRDLWSQFSYKDYSIIAEPYFDTDFNTVFYLTDTGRTWNNKSISIRDKVDSAFKIKVSTTKDIIDLFSQGKMPNQIMFTFHPQRWNYISINWLSELIVQNIKNTVKYLILKKRK